jgi:plasmid stabilization system protein ParE
MEYRVTWSRRARNTLKAIQDHIAEDNVAAAIRLAERIVARTDLLQTTPRIGVLYPVGDDREIRQLVEGNYRIFYQIREQSGQVLIMTVWHAARQEPKL